MTDPTRGSEGRGDASRDARVVASHRGRWVVLDAEGVTRLVPARSRLRSQGIVPVTGDRVEIDAGGAICCVRPRTGVIVRRAAGRPSAGQVLAANVDVALLAEPLPAPNARRLERLVALAAAGDVRPVVVLTKADRSTPDARPDPAVALRARLGVDVLALSALTGMGLDAVRAVVGPGRTAVLLGPSGAGKSTLVNCLAGVERARIGPVRAVDDRGRHTTVARELVRLPGGAALIDTPGIREVGMWDDVAPGFVDIDDLARACRFADCAHDTEPGCAVRDTVDPDRLADWRALRREAAWVEDRRAASRAREARGRMWARAARAQRRKGGG